MTTWDERMRPRPPSAPRLELLETCWRMRGPSGRTLTCGLHATAAGVELRCGYNEDLLRSQLVPDLAAGRLLAAEWRQAVLAKGGFEELLAAQSIPSIEPFPGGRIVRNGQDVQVQISGDELARAIEKAGE